MNGVHRVSEKVYNERNARAIPQTDDLIFAREAPAGNIAIIQEGEKVCLGQRTVLLRPMKQYILPMYLVYYILSPLTQQNLVDKSFGTTVAHVNLSDFRPYLVAIPPIEEQTRIVNIIEELLPLVHKYGHHEEALSELNNSMPNLIKKSILQEAIQGKLVPQDPNDEPASILLGRIKEEKLRLVKEGRLKKKDIVNTVIFKGDDNKYYEKVGHKTVEITDEIPFDIPESWSWCRLKQCSELLYGFPFDSQRFNDAGIGSPVVRIRNVVPGTTNTYTDEPCSQRYLIKPGDMLVGMDGNFNVQFWKGAQALLNQRVCRINANQEVVLQRFLFYYLPIAFEEIEKGVSFVTVKHLSDKHLTNQLVPIPPIQEQKRIIDKIDSLLNLIK